MIIPNARLYYVVDTSRPTQVFNTQADFFFKALNVYCVCDKRSSFEYNICDKYVNHK